MALQAALLRHGGGVAPAAVSSSVRLLCVRSTAAVAMALDASENDSYAAIRADGRGDRSKSASSLRADLGSGAALGSITGATSNESTADVADPAMRRAQLLGGKSRFYDTVTVVQYTPEQGTASVTGSGDDARPSNITASVSSSSSGSGSGSSSSESSRTSSPSSNSSSDGQIHYQLLLGRHPVRTPAKQLLLLPSRALALAVAAEWEWLPRGRPAPHLMPLTSLAATALDQPREPARVIDALLTYLHTDAACVRYEPGPLASRQAQVLDPLLAWAGTERGWALSPSHSIAGAPQSMSTEIAVRDYLTGEEGMRALSARCSAAALLQQLWL